MKKNLKAILMACLATCTAAALVACSGNNGEGNGGENGGGDNPPAGEYGTVCIEDMTVYIDSNKNKTFAEIEPVFTKPDKKEDLTYTMSTTDAKSLDITNGIATPKKRENKTVNVTAKSEHFETTFKVEIELISYEEGEMLSLYEYKDVNNNDLTAKVNNRATVCSKATENTTLFLGDSFMDSDFIVEYWATYSVKKDVINAGISSSTSYHWERACSKIIGDTAPKNVVIHVGTNNFYDFHDTVEDTEASLMRLFMYIHTSYPTTNIYWFNITQRTDTKYAEQVKQTNAYIANRAEELDFLTVVDTSSKVTSAMLRDGVHPTKDNYKVFTDELVKAGCEIAAKA